MNRAVHGDVVVVEVFDEKEWKAPADEVIDQESRYSTLIVNRSADFYAEATLKDDDVEEAEEEGEENEVFARESKVVRSEIAKRTVAEKQPTGRVVGIIKRNWRA
jgi:exosome complex exonuclease DIS3/RRP44